MKNMEKGKNVTSPIHPTREKREKKILKINPEILASIQEEIQSAIKSYGSDKKVDFDEINFKQTSFGGARGVYYPNAKVINIGHTRKKSMAETCLVRLKNKQVLQTTENPLALELVKNINFYLTLIHEMVHHASLHSTVKRESEKKSAHRRSRLGFSYNIDEKRRRLDSLNEAMTEALANKIFQKILQKYDDRFLGKDAPKIYGNMEYQEEIHFFYNLMRIIAEKTGVWPEKDFYLSFFRGDVFDVLNFYIKENFGEDILSDLIRLDPENPEKYWELLEKMKNKNF